MSVISPYFDVMCIPSILNGYSSSCPSVQIETSYFLIESEMILVKMNQQTCWMLSRMQLQMVKHFVLDGKLSVNACVGVCKGFVCCMRLCHVPCVLLRLACLCLSPILSSHFLSFWSTSGFLFPFEKMFFQHLPGLKPSDRWHTNIVL